VKKYMEEIANYRSFLKICDEIVQLNERICNLRAIPVVEDKNEEEDLKKKLQMLFRRKYRKRLTGL
jgi:hypothetical protein